MRSMFLTGMTALVLLTGPMAAESPAPSLSLNEALAITYETSPQLAAAQAGLRAIDEDVAAANAGWRPQIAATGTYRVYNYKYMYKDVKGNTPVIVNSHPLVGQLGITEPIFQGGRTYAGIGKAKANVRSGRANLIATEQTVLLAAVTAYMDVVRDTAIVQLRRRNVEVLRKQRDATALEFKAGSLTRTDTSQAEARLAAADADLTTAEGQLSVSHANFMEAIGRPAETLEQTPSLPALPQNEDEAAAYAVHDNPALMAAREDERAASYAVDEAVSALLPQASITGGYSYSQGEDTSALGTGLVVHGLGVSGTISVPLYQGGAEYAAVRKAKELHAQTNMNISLTDRQVRGAVATAWNTYRAAVATIDSKAAMAKADEIAFAGVSKEQRVGGRTILDVLNAQQEYLNAQVAVVSARRDAVVAAYQLLSASGKLTAKGLMLNVNFYNPTDHYDRSAAKWLGF